MLTFTKTLPTLFGTFWELLRVETSLSADRVNYDPFDLRDGPLIGSKSVPLATRITQVCKQSELGPRCSIISLSLSRCAKNLDRNKFEASPLVRPSWRFCRIRGPSLCRRSNLFLNGYFGQKWFEMKRVFAEFRDLLQLGQSCLQSSCRLKRDCH